MRSHAIRGLRLLLEAREARERALATGMDAVLQDLRSRTAGPDDSAFAQDIEVTSNKAEFGTLRTYHTLMPLSPSSSEKRRTTKLPGSLSPFNVCVPRG